MFYMQYCTHEKFTHTPLHTLMQKVILQSHDGRLSEKINICKLYIAWAEMIEVCEQLTTDELNASDGFHFSLPSHSLYPAPL